VDSSQDRKFQVAQYHEERRVDTCGHEHFRVDIRVDMKVAYFFQFTIAGASAASTSVVAGEGGLKVSNASTAARFAATRMCE